jgi:hypothetical protein
MYPVYTCSIFYVNHEMLTALFVRCTMPFMNATNQVKILILTALGLSGLCFTMVEA